MRRHKRLARTWRRRVIGRHTSIYVWAVWTVLLFVTIGLHLESRWALWAGMMLGATIVGWWMLREALLPGWISNWQIGAWGEQVTAKELARLPRNWAVRHDVASPAGGNRDHVVGGPSVYVLDTKNLSDSIVTVEGATLRVSRIDDPEEDGYVFDRFPVKRAAYWLGQDAETQVGFPIAIYPVLVIWARFDAKVAWLGNLAVVRGDLIADWLQSRPADLLRDDRRAAAAAWVKALPQA